MHRHSQHVCCVHALRLVSLTLKRPNLQHAGFHDPDQHCCTSPCHPPILSSPAGYDLRPTSGLTMSDDEASPETSPLPQSRSQLNWVGSASAPAIVTLPTITSGAGNITVSSTSAAASGLRANGRPADMVTAHLAADSTTSGGSQAPVKRDTETSGKLLLAGGPNSRVVARLGFEDGRIPGEQWQVLQEECGTEVRCTCTTSLQLEAHR